MTTLINKSLLVACIVFSQVTFAGKEAGDSEIVIKKPDGSYELGSLVLSKNIDNSLRIEESLKTYVRKLIKQTDSFLAYRSSWLSSSKEFDVAMFADTKDYILVDPKDLDCEDKYMLDLPGKFEKQVVACEDGIVFLNREIYPKLNAHEAALVLIHEGMHTLKHNFHHIQIADIISAIHIVETKLIPNQYNLDFKLSLNERKVLEAYPKRVAQLVGKTTYNKISVSESGVISVGNPEIVINDTDPSRPTKIYPGVIIDAKGKIELDGTSIKNSSSEVTVLGFNGSLKNSNLEGVKLYSEEWNDIVIEDSKFVDSKFNFYFNSKTYAYRQFFSKTCDLGRVEKSLCDVFPEIDNKFRWLGHANDYKKESPKIRITNSIVTESVLFEPYHIESCQISNVENSELQCVDSSVNEVKNMVLYVLGNSEVEKVSMDSTAMGTKHLPIAVLDRSRLSRIEVGAKSARLLAVNSELIGSFYLAQFAMNKVSVNNSILRGNEKILSNASIVDSKFGKTDLSNLGDDGYISTDMTTPFWRVFSLEDEIVKYDTMTAWNFSLSERSLLLEESVGNLNLTMVNSALDFTLNNEGYSVELQNSYMIFDDYVSGKLLTSEIKVEDSIRLSNMWFLSPHIAEYTFENSIDGRGESYIPKGYLFGNDLTINSYEKLKRYEISVPMRENILIMAWDHEKLPSENPNFLWK